MSRQQQIQEWLTEARAQGARRVELRVKLDGSMVRAWPLVGNENAGTPGDEEIAAQIVKRAEREGLAQPSQRVTFTVMAFLEGEAYCDRTMLVVDGANAKGRGLEEEAEPTTIGILMQLSRMVGEQHRLLLSSQESRHVHAERMIERLESQNATLQAERLKVWETAERLSNMQLEREAARRSLELEGKRDEFLFQKLDAMIPVLLNRLLGGGPGKGTPFFGEEMVRVLLGSLSGEQVDAMLQNQPLSLSQEQMAIIAELTMAYKQREEQRKKRSLNGVAPTATSGETNGKGDPS